MRQAKALLRITLGAGLLGASLHAQPESREPFTGKYCLACHSERAKSGGFVLEGVPHAEPASRPEVWEKAIKKIRAGEMPPAGMPRPDEASTKNFVNGLIAELDRAAQRAPFAGRPVIRRLNRTEYANAIRDLLDLELPLSAELPQDQIAAGFDNVADALSMSPLLLERYLKVARRVSELATGTRDPSPVVEIFPPPGPRLCGKAMVCRSVRGAACASRTSSRGMATTICARFS